MQRQFPMDEPLATAGGQRKRLATAIVRILVGTRARRTAPLDPADVASRPDQAAQATRAPDAPASDVEWALKLMG